MEGSNTLVGPTITGPVQDPLAVFPQLMPKYVTRFPYEKIMI